VSMDLPSSRHSSRTKTVITDQDGEENHRERGHTDIDRYQPPNPRGQLEVKDVHCQATRRESPRAEGPARCRGIAG